MTVARTILACTLALGLAACEQPAAAPQQPTDTAEAAPAAQPAPADGVLNRPLLNASNRKFVEAVDICLNAFPNTLAARQKYRTSSYDFEGTFGGLNYFTAFNRNIIAFTKSGTSEPLCGFGRDGLRDEEAVILVNGILAAKYGENLLTGDTSDDPETLAAWLVTTDNDTEVVVAVRRQIVLSGLYRGSLVYVGEYRGAE